MLVIFYSFSSVLFKRLLYLKAKLLAPCNLEKKKNTRSTQITEEKCCLQFPTKLDLQKNVMSKSCRVILSTFVDEYTTLLPRPSQPYKAKAACVMDAYANIDFLRLTSKCLQIILVHSESLSLSPVADKRVNRKCLCVHFC